MEPNPQNNYFDLPPDVDVSQCYDPQLDDFDLRPPAIPQQHVAGYSYDILPPYNPYPSQRLVNWSTDSHNALQHVLQHQNLQQHEFQHHDTYTPHPYGQEFQQRGFPQPDSSQLDFHQYDLQRNILQHRNFQQHGFQHHDTYTPNPHGQRFQQHGLQQHEFHQPSFHQPSFQQPGLQQPGFHRPSFHQYGLQQHNLQQPRKNFGAPSPSNQVFAPSTFQQYGDPSFAQSQVKQPQDRGDLQKSGDISRSRSSITPLPLPSPPQHVNSNASTSQLNGGADESNSDAGIVQSPFLNGGYWPSWKHCDKAALHSVELTPISHVNYAFAEVANDRNVKLKNSNIHYDGGIDEVNQELLAWLQRRRSTPNLKIMVSIGGGASPEIAQTFADVAADIGKRRTFAASINKLVESYRLDGIDIYWEYPANRTEGLNYALLLMEVREILGCTPWVSIALPAKTRVLNQLPLSRIEPYVNFINLMTYDFFDSDLANLGTTSHHAQLYAGGLVDEVNYMTCGDVAVTYLRDRGVFCRKIMLGIPLYGRVFKGATGPGQPYDRSRSDLRFAHEVKNLPPHGMKQMFDKGTCAAFVSGPDEFITYDSVMSVKAKAKYVKKYNLRGLFHWHLAGDRHGNESLINAAYTVLSVEHDKYWYHPPR